MKTKMMRNGVRLTILVAMLDALIWVAPPALPQTHAAPTTPLGDLPPAAQALISATLGRGEAAYQF